VSCVFWQWWEVGWKGGGCGGVWCSEGWGGAVWRGQGIRFMMGVSMNIHLTWLVHMCAMAHAHAWHDSCICVAWWFVYTHGRNHWYVVSTISRLLEMKVSFAKEPYKRDYILQNRRIILRSLLIVATPYVCHDSCICMTYLMHMCDITKIYAWHDPCNCVTWPTDMYHKTRSNVLKGTWLI